MITHPAPETFVSRANRSVDHPDVFNAENAPIPPMASDKTDGTLDHTKEDHAMP